MVDRAGIPLALVLTGANRHDSMALTDVVDAVHPVRQSRGRPRKRPAKLHADKGYDFDRFGKHRWVVERTFAWINQFRRLIVGTGAR